MKNSLKIYNVHGTNENGLWMDFFGSTEKYLMATVHALL